MSKRAFGLQSDVVLHCMCVCSILCFTDIVRNAFHSICVQSVFLTHLLPQHFT